MVLFWGYTSTALVLHWSYAGTTLVLNSYCGVEEFSAAPAYCKDTLGSASRVTLQYQRTSGTPPEQHIRPTTSPERPVTNETAAGPRSAPGRTPDQPLMYDEVGPALSNGRRSLIVGCWLSVGRHAGDGQGRDGGKDGGLGGLHAGGLRAAARGRDSHGDLGQAPLRPPLPRHEFGLLRRRCVASLPAQGLRLGISSEPRSAPKMRESER